MEFVGRWGERRRLAYEVKGRREGLYMIMNFKSEPDATKELDRVFRISEDVMRHIIIYLEPGLVEASKIERDRARVERPEAPAAPVEAPAPVAEAVEEAPAEVPAEEAVTEEAVTEPEQPAVESAEAPEAPAETETPEQES